VFQPKEGTKPELGPGHYFSTKPEEDHFHKHKKGGLMLPKRSLPSFLTNIGDPSLPGPGEYN